MSNNYKTLSIRFDGNYEKTKKIAKNSHFIGCVVCKKFNIFQFGAIYFQVKQEFVLFEISYLEINYFKVSYFFCFNSYSAFYFLRVKQFKFDRKLMKSLIF